MKSPNYIDRLYATEYVNYICFAFVRGVYQRIPTYTSSNRKQNEKNQAAHHSTILIFSMRIDIAKL